MMWRPLIISLALIGYPSIASAQTGPDLTGTASISDITEIPIAASPVQEKCITIMAGFPDNGHESRYQFFKLAEQLSKDTTPFFRAALDYYGSSTVTVETPVIEVIENIANPVFRQAAPEITIGNMAYLIDFAMDCDEYLNGQIDSLQAFDPALTHTEFNLVIAEDALFLRQILSESLYRLDAQNHEIFGESVQAYDNSLVQTRDQIEFAGFESELESIEALYLADLDGRLARSNDVINSEMNRNSLENALETTDDLNQRAKMESKRKMLETLSRILGGNG